MMTRGLPVTSVAMAVAVLPLERDGDYGKHFDNVKMEFIRDHVAPLIMRSPAR